MVMKFAVAIILFVTACDSPPAQKAASNDAASTNNSLIIIQNPDGTFSVQKDGSRLDTNSGTTKTGLVIPAQVVVPIVLKR
jgi:hypothetical protein